MASAFLKVEGNTVKNRIWSFLIIHSDFDYSMKEIAKHSKVSYTALKEIWKEFCKRGMVIHTRDVGKAKMYKLNVGSPQVNKFIDYYWAVVDSVARKELKMDKEESTNHSASVGALPVSAKSI